MTKLLNGRSSSGDLTDIATNYGVRALLWGVSVAVRRDAFALAAPATRRPPTAKKYRFALAAS
jgi:hypothetical protein